MGLVKCPDCGHDVSDLAPACPQCARPMQGADKPVTIERTSKHYKGLMLIAVAILVLSALLVDSAPSLAGFLGLSAIVLFLGALVGAWWHNG